MLMRTALKVTLIALVGVLSTALWGGSSLAADRGPANPKCLVAAEKLVGQSAEDVGSDGEFWCADVIAALGQPLGDDPGPSNVAALPEGPASPGNAVLIDLLWDSNIGHDPDHATHVAVVQAVGAKGVHVIEGNTETSRTHVTRGFWPNGAIIGYRLLSCEEETPSTSTTTSGPTTTTTTQPTSPTTTTAPKAPTTTTTISPTAPTTITTEAPNVECVTPDGFAFKTDPPCPEPKTSDPASTPPTATQSATEPLQELPRTGGGLASLTALGGLLVASGGTLRWLVR